MSTRTLLQVLEASTDLARIAIENITAVLHHPGVNSEDRLDVMLALTRRKPVNVFWRVFHETWRDCDDTYDSRNRLLRVLTMRDAESRSTDYLPDAARAFLEALPNPFVAFRGCCKQRVMGLSWTTSEAIAEEFARGHRGSATSSGCLATASVPKSAVFGVYLDGEEAELVINLRRTRLSTRQLSLAAQSAAPLSMHSQQPNGKGEWEQIIRLVPRLSSQRHDEDILNLTDLAP